MKFKLNTEVIRAGLLGVIIVLLVGYFVVGKVGQTDFRISAAYTCEGTCRFACRNGEEGGTGTCEPTKDCCVNVSAPTPTGSACKAGNLGTSCCNGSVKCQEYRDGNCKVTCSANCGSTSCSNPTSTPIPTIGPSPTTDTGCTCTDCSYRCTDNSATCSGSNSVYTCKYEGTSCGGTKPKGAICGSTPTNVCIDSCLGGTIGGPTCIATKCSPAYGANCTGGIAYKDNCGRSGCGTCAGAPTNPPGPTNTPKPNCTPNCNCATNLCSTQSCMNNCNTTYCTGLVNPTAPTAPVLNTPVNLAIKYVGTLRLSWNTTASWGICPGTKTYSICVGKNATDPCVGGTVVTDIGATKLFYDYVQPTAGTYYWKVGANNGTTRTTIFSTIRSFTMIVNTRPTVGVLTVKNAGSTTVAWDASGRAQICNMNFQNSAAPRTVILSTTLTDSDGFADITGANLQWNGTIYPMTLAAGAGTNRSASVTIPFVAGVNTSLPQLISVQAIDTVAATAYISTGKLFKVWNCLVPVKGNMYDSSSVVGGGVCLSGVGFDTLAGNTMNFKNVRIGVSSFPVVTFNTFNLGSLIWGNPYSAAPNIDIQAKLLITRWRDNNNLLTISCGGSQTLNSATVDPYYASPSMTMDFSATPNHKPTKGALTMLNSAGTLVGWDTGGKGHNCMTAFQGALVNKDQVLFRTTLTDLDGYADITGANLILNGINYTMTLSNGSGNTVLATATLNADVTNYTGSTMPISIGISDTVSSSLIATVNTFKSWNCQVPTSGNMYDSSAQASGAVCSTGVGFNVLADETMKFNSVSYGGMSVSTSNYNAYNSINLYWGKNYTLSPNSDLMASGVKTRWVNPGIVGVGSTPCGSSQTILNNVVDPYMVAPTLKVDFAATLNQSTWFQVVGAGIIAGNSINNMVPSTCANDLTLTCKPGMTIESAAGTKDNGIVAGSAISNDSGCSMTGTGHSCFFGVTNDWSIVRNILSGSDKYDYEYFYSKYFSGLGLGVTMTGNAKMSDIVAAPIGGTGVVLVSGDLDIDVNNTVDVGKILMVIVNGQINIQPDVTASAGILVTDGGLTASGDGAVGLIHSGSIYSSLGDIKLNRNFTNPVDNNINPSVTVKFRPDFIFNIPGAMLKVFSEWKQL